MRNKTDTLDPYPRKQPQPMAEIYAYIHVSPELPPSHPHLRSNSTVFPKPSAFLATTI